jgi:DNA-binding transcriptional LysR family regulator
MFLGFYVLSFIAGDSCATMDVVRWNWTYRLLDFMPERLRIAACAAHAFHRKTGRWLPPLADKVLVKDYVRRKLGDDWLTPTLWHGRELPPVSHCTWPLPIVIKSNADFSPDSFSRDLMRLWRGATAALKAG